MQIVRYKLGFLGQPAIKYLTCECYQTLYGVNESGKNNKYNA